MIETIKCGHMVMVEENGRYVGGTSMLTMSVAMTESGFWTWGCLPLGNSIEAFEAPQQAAESLRYFLELNLKELEAVV